MKYHLCSSELKLATLLFGLAICLSGCSSSYTVSSAGKPNAEYSYGEMNEERTGRDVIIELRDRRHISAKDVRISDDSVSWVDQQTDEASKARILERNKIVTNSSSMGALEGAGFGLVGGGGFGGLVGQIVVGNESEWGTDAGPPAV